MKQQSGLLAYARHYALQSTCRGGCRCHWLGYATKLVAGGSSCWSRAEANRVVEVEVDVDVDVAVVANANAIAVVVEPQNSAVWFGKILEFAS